MSKKEKLIAVTVSLNERLYKELMKAAEADWNTPEYELRIAVRLGLQQLLGEEIEEDD